MERAASFGTFWPVVLLCLVIGFSASRPARSHDPGLSTASVVLEQDMLSIRLTLSSNDVNGLLGRDAHRTDSSLVAHSTGRARPELRAVGGQAFIVRHEGRVLAARRVTTESKPDEFVFVVEFDRPASRQKLELVAAVLGHLPRGHRMYVEVRDTGGRPGTTSRVLDAANNRLELAAGGQ